MKIEQLREIYKNEKLETDRINFNKLAELYTDIEYVKYIVLKSFDFKYIVLIKTPDLKSFGF